MSFACAHLENTSRRCAANRKSKGRAACAARPVLNVRSGRADQNAFTTSSVTFLASPNNIMVLSRKNNSFSTPA